MADPPAEATIRQVKILDAGCVLGLVQTKERAWRIANLVSQQPLPLPEAHLWTLNVRLAPNGQAVVYQDTQGQLTIRPLDPHWLAQSATQLQLEFVRRQRTTPPHLASFFEPVESQEEWQESLQAALAQPDWSAGAETAWPPERQINEWLSGIKATSQQGGAYGLAILPPEDNTTLPRWREAITPIHERVLQVVLPQPGPRIKERALLAYIVQRPMRPDEMTSSVIAELESQPYDVIVIDQAEKLHHEAMLGLCGSLQRITGAFVLIVRNWEAFMAEAGKIRAGLDWFLSRAIWNKELTQLSQPKVVLAEEGQAELPLLTSANQSRLEFQLYRLKTATPRAQGGYGLATLPPADQTTVQQFVEKVRQQTSDRILLAQLPEPGPRIKLRQLVESIVGRSLRRGEPTEDVLHRQIQGRYHIIVLDRAERLHHSTLLWICDNLRTVADAFLLVVRDSDEFMKSVDKTGEPAWTLGRSIRMDLVRLVSGD
ncbi:MAG: hypothetical protein BroJett011_67330 [Chloroflexota bacterium]|nr:MAG: hypothetical protein BroJett011_67330 [Chloroflexota bacterium]